MKILPSVFALLATLGSGASIVGADDRSSANPATDWLVDPAPYKAQVKAAGKDLVLDNGLARRVIRLAPNAATIDLQCLVTGERVLRAVSPEARVTIGGVEYPVGGLSGQKVNNYIKAEWLDTLEPMPGAYSFRGWAEQPIVERFKWKKRPEWLAHDMPWPLPGKHVVLSFDPPAKRPTPQAPVLFKEKFGASRELGQNWTIRASKAHPRTSFFNEGKTGEILSLPDCGVYAEMAWPDGARSIEVELDAGDDAASERLGPGLALVAADGEATGFVLIPNKEVFATPLGVGGSFDRGKPVRLQVRVLGDALLCEAAQDGAEYQLVATLRLGKPVTHFRIGRLRGNGKGGDAPTAANEPVRCHILSVTIRGAEPARPATVASPRADLPAVDIHYELYDGLPVFAKWIEVRNTTGSTVHLDHFVSEELRFVESAGSLPPLQTLWVETDYAFGGGTKPDSPTRAVTIGPDPYYSTQVNFGLQSPCLLRCEPSPIGPDVDIPSGGSFQGFRAFELLLDSTERERSTLAQRRMYRAIAPWTNENPLMFHQVKSDPATIRAAIDQAAEVGFEMVIMSFGSGFNLESRDRKYWDTFKDLADYGRSRGVALGGYSLLASRHAANRGDDTQGEKATFGSMPCLGTQWGRDYLDNIVAFISHAGFGVFENDGSYPGDRCAATNHPFHHGLADSQWVMWKAITNQYQALRSEGVFLNVPDWYYLAGANKCGMGYRETNWSLPRAEQEIIERQNMFDGTWSKSQTMGWMFVPLSQYHGGGAAATIEPLNEHRAHYEARLGNLLGYGVQACWRGPKLYDTDQTKALVRQWVKFYKDHREALDFGDIIHLRRANGLDWDGVLHVNPQGEEKGLAFFYNPLPEDIEREIRVPLYYAGLRTTARVSVNGGQSTSVRLDAAQTAMLRIRIPAQGRTWVLFRAE